MPITDNVSQNIVSKIIDTVKHYPTLSFFVAVLGCGLIATSYLCKKNDTSFFKKKISASALPANSITPLSDLPEIYRQMDPSTWPKNYPVPLSQLAYVKLNYWGFDDKVHSGALIVHKDLAPEVLEIFSELFLNKFPIEQMRPIYEFKNSDDDSMAANNSSAFNCREVTGQPGIFSQHSYGRAIDINPRENPYVKKALVLPPGSEVFADRDVAGKGKISRDSLPFRLFARHGWDWGGNWNDLQDFQHFEKRANGEKRDPEGYASKKNL